MTEEATHTVKGRDYFLFSFPSIDLKSDKKRLLELGAILVKMEIVKIGLWPFRVIAIQMTWLVPLDKLKEFNETL